MPIQTKSREDLISSLDLLIYEVFHAVNSAAEPVSEILVSEAGKQLKSTVRAKLPYIGQRHSVKGIVLAGGIYRHILKDKTAALG